MLSFFRNKLTLLGQAWATTAPSTASSAMMQAIRHTSSSQPSEYITTNLENGVGRYVCQLQRITFRFCKESPGSQGMREFIENDLVDFARKNPGVVVYLEPKRHRMPKMNAEYLGGNSHSINVHQFSREKMLKWLEFLRTRKGGVLMRLLKKQKTHMPSVQGVWTPFTNKPSWLATERFPSPKLSTPADFEPSATDKILKLFEEQQKRQQQQQQQTGQSASKLP